MTAPYAGAPQGGPWQPAPTAPVKKRSKGPLVLLLVGALILVLGLLAGILTAVIGFGATAKGIGDIQVYSSGSGTYTAEAGEDVQAYMPEGSAMPSCSVTTPDGAQPGDGVNQSSSTTIDGQTWVSFDSFTATSAGDYQIDCGGAPVALGPPVSIGGIFGGIGGVLLAVFGGLLGFLILLGGIIWMVVQRRRTA